MKKLLLVMNPRSGTRKANKVLPDILSEFCAADYEVSIYMTQKQGDCRKEVSRRANQMDLIVCCGGDGTFNEAVSGVLDAGTRTPIGYIPSGSTNDFAASLGIPTDPLKAARAILAGTPTEYDVCSFGGRYFTYIASFGAFTKTSYNTPQNIKNMLGHTAYVLSGIPEVTQIRSVPLRIDIDGETVEGNYVFGAICNSTSLGGVFNLDPKQVDLQDGQFEILLVRAPKNPAEVAECIQAVQKQVYNCSMVTFRSASRITLYPDPDTEWTLDGEWEPGHEQVLVENHQQAFRLMI